MSITCHIPRSVLVRIFLALVFACLGGAMPLYAQEHPCDRPGGKRGDGDDIKCRMGMLLEKQQTFLEKTKAHVDQRCPEGNQCQTLKKNMEKAQTRRTRAANAHNRATASDYEDLTVKGNGKRKKKGGNSSSQDQTTQEPEEEEEEPQPDLATGQDIADELDEAIESVDDANQALDSDAGTQSASLTLNQASGKFQPSYAFREERTRAGVALAAFIAFRVSHTLAEVSEKYCDQTVVVAGFGGNFSAGCAVFFWVAQAAEHVHETLSFLDDDVNAAEIEGAFERAGQVYDLVTDLQITTNAIQSNTSDTGAQVELFRSDLATHDSGVRGLLADVLEKVGENQQQLRKVMAVQRQIIRLLLLPDGKRTVDPNVLTCTGDNCPIVLACPGPECSYPLPK